MYYPGSFHPYGDRNQMLWNTYPYPIRLHQDPPLNNPVFLQGSNGAPVPFPVYVPFVSVAVYDLLQMYQDPALDPNPETLLGSYENPISFPNISEAILKVASAMVATLSTAAYTVEGQQTPITRLVYPLKKVTDENIISSIILVNPLIQQAVRPIAQALSRNELTELLLAFNYLQIFPLLNAVSSFIAQVTIPYFQERGGTIPPISLLLEETIPSLTELLMGFGFGALPPVLIMYVRKYIYLLLLGVQEKTVADFIALTGQGQPQNITNEIDMDSQNITGLLGVDLLTRKHKITRLTLSRNSILSNDIDPDFPDSPFQALSALQTLSLDSNQIYQLPEDVFQNLHALEILELSSNQLSILPQGLFKGLHALRWLHLNRNILSILPEGIFQGLQNLRELFLSNNHLSILPQNIFQGLQSLQSLLIQNNHIPGTMEEFRRRYQLSLSTRVQFQPQIRSTTVINTSVHSCAFPVYHCYGRMEYPTKFC